MLVGCDSLGEREYFCKEDGKSVDSALFMND